MKAAQLKALLSRVPDEAEVVIHDADTEWAMPEFEVRKLADGRYTLYGGYGADGNVRDYIDIIPHEVIK